MKAVTYSSYGSPDVLTLFLPITLSRKFDQSKWEQVQLI
jgi:hypothetical protein